MAVNPYATIADAKAWVSPTVPTQSDNELQRMVNRAIDEIDAYLRTATYSLDAAGENPTDATLIVALREATCAQVEQWMSDGTDLPGLESWTTYIINGVTVTRPAAPRGTLCERSRKLLAQVPQLFRNVQIS